MKIFREGSFSQVLRLATTLVFLNMSFFSIIEISSLDLKNDDKRLYDVFTKILSNISEEEKDFAPENENEGKTTIKLIDFLMAGHPAGLACLYVSKKQNAPINVRFPCFGVLQKINQPPENTIA